MLKIVCLGDSLTYGYRVGRTQTWPNLLGQKLQVEVLNKGICGDTTGGFLGRFHTDVVMQQPTHMLLMGGVNDLICQSPLGAVQANISALVFQAYHYGIQPYIGIPIPIETALAREHWGFVQNWDQVNSQLQQLRQWVFTFSKAFDCQYIDFYKLFLDDSDGCPRPAYYLDGLHPTPAGNALMADFISL